MLDLKTCYLRHGSKANKRKQQKSVKCKSILKSCIIIPGMYKKSLSKCPLVIPPKLQNMVKI